MPESETGLAYLGSGYDVCGLYADAVSIKRKIFDLEKVPEHSIRQFPNRKAEFFSISGESVDEYQRSLSAKVRVDGTYKLFSGSLTASFSSDDLSISESSFVSINLCMRYETWKLQTRSQEYMYPNVVEDFKTRDGKWLIEHYGAAVVTGFDIGGRWSDNFTVSTLFTNSTKDVEASMKAAYGAFISGSGSTEVSNTVKKKESIANRRKTVVGGNPALTSGEADNWQGSVESSLAFMDFTEDGLTFVWDLFPEQKEKLRSAFEAYVRGHELTFDRLGIIEASFTYAYKYASDAGSEAKLDLDLYKPYTSDTRKYFGVGGNNNRLLVVRELGKYGAVRPVEEWQPIWNDRGSGTKKEYNCWVPKAPPGFVALGIYCRFGVHGQDKPSKDDAEGMVVVHHSLVEPTQFSRTKVWKDSGTKADYDLTLGELYNNSLWPQHTSDPRAGILPGQYKLKQKFIR